MREVTWAVITFAVLSSTAGGATYEISTDSIYKHVAVLAADSMEGRQAGEPGEWKSAQYIISVFQQAGLEPRGDGDSYLQAFEFTKRVESGPDNRLTVNQTPLKIGEDYQILEHSASTVFEFDEVVNVGYGIVTEDSSYNDYQGLDTRGKAVLIRRYVPKVAGDSTGADTTYNRYGDLTSKILSALDHGAAGVFFYTPETEEESMITIGAVNATPKDIPLIFLSRSGLQRLGLDLSNPRLTNVSGVTELVRVQDTAYNVVGYLPGSSDSVQIVSAHYDHIGWGEVGSRYSGTEKNIHNGADDNSSGTAALLELARYFGPRLHELDKSLLFIAFSCEEAGMLGSGHYVRNWTVDPTKTRLIINMDMIGRLSPEKKELTILGTGSCPEFKKYFEGGNLNGLTLAYSVSGYWPSDHTPFYYDSIPCLSFFTGAHEDFHTPEDDIEKLNVSGIVTVANLVADILTHFDAYPATLAFQRTKDEEIGGLPLPLPVTLGIMPDVISQVQGLGVEGVSLDLPADRAGIVRRDIIIRIDRHEVRDIYDYVHYLLNYLPDDTCMVQLVRGVDTLSVKVDFN